MQYTHFKKNGPKVSRLGFGAMGFAGWFGDQSENKHIDSLHAALDQGVNFIDTARAYEKSEHIVGKALKSWQGDTPFLATKIECLGSERRWAMPSQVETTFPKRHIRQSMEESLRQLGVESVDLIQLHLYWPTWGVNGYWMDDLQQLKDEGKAKYIGISVPDHRSDAMLPLVNSGLIDSVQTIVNIFDPLPFECLMPACEENDVAILARCVLDEGGLTGTLTVDTTFPPEDYRARYFDGTVPLSTYVEKVDALKQFIPEHASSLAALALKFVTHPAGITTALSSMHHKEYAKINIDAFDEPDLSEDIFDLLRTKHRFVKNFNNAKQWD